MASKQYRDGDPTREIVVEGSDDFHFLFQWLTQANLLSEFCFREATGIDEVLKLFPVILKESGLVSLAIIIDANSSPSSRWESVRVRLIRFGYEARNIPEEPILSGFVLRQAPLPVVGVWLMPDNAHEGYLEHFVAALIDDQDELWPRAQAVVDELPAESRRFSAGHLAKAKIHTWLAWQREPGIPMGLALRERYFRVEAEMGRAFQAWLEELR